MELEKEILEEIKDYIYPTIRVIRSKKVCDELTDYEKGCLNVMREVGRIIEGELPDDESISL